jgi:LPXTG-motif cell wall-anchored protein
MKAYKIFLVAVMMLLATMVGAFAATGTGTETSPTLRFSVSTYSPIPAEPGKTVDVWISIQNIGGTDALNTKINFVDSSAFSLISEADRVVTVPIIGSNSDYTAKYTLKVSNSVVDGPNDINFEYTIGNQPGVTSTAKVSIDVKSAETPISVSGMTINPSPLSPGGKTTLSLNIRNMAKSSNIRNVAVALQLTPIISGTTVVDLPFVTVNSGNDKSVDRILPGQSADFSFDLAAYPSAVAGLYKLPILISYYDDTGTKFTTTILAGIEVNAKSDILVNVESSDLNKKMKSGNVLFNIVNRGTTGVKLMTLSLEPSADYKTLPPSSEVYIGKIDSDDFQTAKFNVQTTKSDNVTFKIKLTYKDSLNNEYTEIHSVTYQLNEPAKTGSSSSFIWFIVVVVLIVGGIVWYRRNKNKNKNKNR